MPKEIKDLQKLIEERAERKFDEDYDRDTKAIRNSDLFGGDVLEFEYKDDKGYRCSNRAYWAFGIDREYYRKLKAHWLPIYIERESEQFLKDVERLKGDVDELLNSQNQ